MIRTKPMITKRVASFEPASAPLFASGAGPLGIPSGVTIAALGVWLVHGRSATNPSTAPLNASTS
jgi:hypothetical protein